MTRHCDRKILIRACMALTGARYTEVVRRFDQLAGHNNVLIADTIDPLQRYLEASLLLAWADAAWLHHWSGNDLRSFVRTTDPASDRLTIGVSDVELLAPMLGRVLPIRIGASMIGIPGLRAYVSDGQLELRLHSPRNRVRAAVRLTGLGRHDFTETLAGLAAGRQHTLFATEAVDDPRERAMFHGPRRGNTSVLSGILRRIPLWRTATDLQLHDAGHGVTVSWHGDPDPQTVCRVLSRSKYAIDHCEARVNRPYSIALSPAPNWSRTSRNEGGLESLRACRSGKQTLTAQPVAPSYERRYGSARFLLTPDVDAAFRANNPAAVAVLCRQMGVPEQDAERFVALLAAGWSR
jgi:hypothetical protein